MRRVVISGCAGKTRRAFVAELRRRGQRVVGDPGRRVLDAEMASGETTAAGVEPQRFADLAFWMALGDHGAVEDDLTFFDGSALDVAAWYARNGSAPPSAVPTYDREVIVVPPGPEVWTAAARPDHALHFTTAEYDDHLARFAGWGYVCSVLPRRTPAAQADWVLERLAQGASA